MCAVSVQKPNRWVFKHENVLLLDRKEEELAIKWMELNEMMCFVESVV